MSKGYLKNVSSRKTNFKAAENFLRKVAFNLGNTRSMTEVKIISCIPIDVTDLQQKIFQLQNELANVKDKDNSKVCATCAIRDHSTPKQVLCNKCFLSTTSVLSVFCSGGRPSAQLSPGSSSEPVVSCPRVDNLPKTEEAAKCRNFLGKKKRYKKKGRSRLVYCAQTDTKTPFTNQFRLTDDLTPMKAKAEYKSENLNRSYLANVIKRQYRHRPLANEFSNLSDISFPICKDHVPTCSPNSHFYESDVCSCFHGQFQNVDNYMNIKNNFNIYSTGETVGKFDKSAYYDSKFYDLIPVKEKKIKVRNDIGKHNGEPYKHTIKTWQEKARPRLRHRHAPAVVNYCTVSTLQNEWERVPVRSLYDKHLVGNRKAAKLLIASTPRRATELDLGPIYAKPVRVPMKRNVITITAEKHNVASGSPAETNVADRQTAATAGTITDPPEDKTETALNQIKHMLQTVLREVKTKSDAGNIPVTAKKDAIVQNGPARCFEYGESKLLQSYTYSPYNAFLPSCSHPMACSNYVYPEYPGAQGVPFQQYPLLIQPQKHMCNHYYRNSNFTKPVSKHAACAATNTEKAQERSKETEQLIKEIYKSMALSIDESSKDNSYREYTKPQAIAKKYVDVAKVETTGDSRSITQAISELFRNTHPRDSTVTGTTDTTLNSYLNPNETKVTSKHTVKKDYKTERNYPQHELTSKCKRYQEKDRMPTYHEVEEESDESDDTVIENAVESSTDTETADVVEDKKEPVKPMEAKKQKSGIFKKMLKIFQPRRRRRRIDNESEKESESDSDDYETVYSHKAVDATPKSKKVEVVRGRPHSKVFYSKEPQNRRSRTKSPEKNTRFSPYLEQEYRRYWDEKLMLHENPKTQNTKRYSTGASRRTADRSHTNRHVYYQNYETRPVLLEPSRPLRIPGNVKPRYKAIKTGTRHGENYNGSRPHNAGCNKYQVRNTTDVGTSGPHYITAKSNGNRKSSFTKGVLKKCKPACASQWKDLIING